MTLQCDECGRMTLEQRHGDFEFHWPESFSMHTAVFRNADWLECTSCGQREVPPALAERIEARRYRLEGLTAPDEIRAVRERLELNQVAMARLIGVGEKTYTRWENGLSLQTKSMDNLIWFAAVCPQLFRVIDRYRSNAGPSDTSTLRAVRQAGLHGIRHNLTLSLMYAHGSERREARYPRGASSSPSWTQLEAAMGQTVDEESEERELTLAS